MQVGLQVDPLTVSLTQQIVQLLAGALALPPPAAAPAPAPPAAAPAPAPPHPSASEEAGVPAALALAPSPFAGSAASSPGAPAAAGSSPPSVGSAGSAPVLALDLQLSYIDLRFAADPPVTAEGGSTSARTSSSAAAAAAALATLEARLACSGASLSVQSMLDGLAVQVRRQGQWRQRFDAPAPVQAWACTCKAR